MKEKYIVQTILFVCGVLVVLTGYIIHVKFKEQAKTVSMKDVEFLSGNLQLKGTVYAPGYTPIKRPGIVLCHGGTTLGRRLALYVLMAHSLAQRGFIVLTFDFRGFGESEDPRRLRTFADLDFVQDVSAALHVLSKEKWVDPSQLFVVGHSFGAGLGVAAAIRDPRVKKVVSISPGRRTEELYFGENATDPEYAAIRISQDMNIHPPIPKALFNPVLMDYVAEAILDYPVHPPVLLIDGAKEPQADLQFLSEVYDQMTEPKTYVTITEADHYFGTKRDMDGIAEDILYDHRVMTELLDTIVAWIQEKD